MENNTDNIVVSSRVRLARNYKDMPFPQHLGDNVAAVKALVRAADSAADFKHRLIYMSDMSLIDRQALVEQHLISPDLAHKNLGVLLLSADESVAVMINEEDHIRAQCIKNGFSLQECYNTIDRYDDNLSREMPVAYDSDFGYLTACLTNVGTGMRASVMVFLPAMTFSDLIDNFVSIAKQRGITVRGVYGERSNPTGCMYQLSNARSIGKSEQELLENVSKVVSELCASEQGLRRQIYTQQKNLLTDKVYRAYGNLANARLLSSTEFMDFVAYLKFGMAMDIIKFKNIEMLDKLIISVQPANLLQIADREDMDAETRDFVRAAVVRKAMEKLK